jgi:hypothetical protein
VRLVPTIKGPASWAAYAATAPLLILSQHALVALAFAWAKQPLEMDGGFWFLPLRRFTQLPDLSPLVAGVGFAFSLAISWALAVLSFRRASQSGAPFALAGAAIVPLVQIPAVAALILIPRWRAEESPAAEDMAQKSRILEGVLAGMAIIVFAVLISAVSFGAYGWGLFVLTPLIVGMTTGYLVNREVPLERGWTSPIVLSAGALGSLALLMTALEGFVCILLVAPLAALFSVIGGGIGRQLAMVRHRRRTPLYSLAILPAVFALEAAAPPSAAILTNESITISAAPSAVWREVTDDAPIGQTATLAGRLGLAYPLRGQLLGHGVGALRLGEFSTGVATERVTEWLPGKRLGFVVLSQPPAMEEMSPYRTVHAPHVQGYFETGETRFDLEALADGRTRLTIVAAHRLKIDPVLYWEPIARWAIRDNTRRVLRDIKAKAEAARA